MLFPLSPERPKVERLIQRKILLIEDDAAYAKLATILLTSSGYAVTRVTTAEEGVRTARTELPDLILMDGKLPGMSGFQGVQALRQDPRTRHIPIVGLTAARIWGEEERSKARAAGFDDYVEKPIDKDALRAVVGAFLR